MSSRDVTWTVVSWNLHGSARPRVAGAAEALRGLGADVISLQEVQREQAAQIAGALGAQHVWGFKHYGFALQFRRRAEGLAVLTPHQVQLDGVQVISEARRTYSWRRRILVEALVERADASGYRVLDVHLSPEDLAVQRRGEAARVADRVKLRDAPATIVAGDLNDANEPAIVATLEAVGLRDAWSGSTPAFTSPARAPMQTLDHVLVPAAATDVRVDVPPGNWAAWSDHLPVRATFTLQWAKGDFT
jgi:endonuclease/exonuclease/phosphatase family metal-dependent hydrolase